MSDLVIIESFLSKQEVARFSELLSQAPHVDGSVSARAWASDVQKNQQATGAEIQKLGAELVKRLFEDERVARAVYPHRTLQPLFNRYDCGDYYGPHEDNPVQCGIRADVSYTLFLSEPDTYDGGSLVLGCDRKFVRLPAGGIVLYDSGTRHEVTRVTRGTRRAAVGWIQSLVPNPEQRVMLRRFYRGMQMLSEELGPHGDAFIELNRVRNQLMRAWAVL